MDYRDEGESGRAFWKQLEELRKAQLLLLRSLYARSLELRAFSWGLVQISRILSKLS